MDYSDISLDFIERTLKILNDYSGDYEVTLLINCCLGLLVLPKEKHFDSLPETMLETKTEIWGLSQNNVTVDCDRCGYSLKDVIRRIRNGICHFKVSTISDGSGRISKVEVKDRGRFKVELTITQLSDLTSSLAKEILGQNI